MFIKTPNEERFEVIRAVLEEGAAPELLTDWERAWLENLYMENVLDCLAEDNAMVFGSVEDGLLN